MIRLLFIDNQAPYNNHTKTFNRQFDALGSMVDFFCKSCRIGFTIIHPKKLVIVGSDITRELQVIGDGSNEMIPLFKFASFVHAVLKEEFTVDRTGFIENISQTNQWIYVEDYGFLSPATLYACGIDKHDDIQRYHRERAPDIIAAKALSVELGCSFQEALAP